MSVQPTERRLFGAWNRTLEPIRDARGVPRWILWAGVVLTLFFIIMALTAPWISPYHFDQYKDAAGHRFPKQGHPSSEHLFGTMKARMAKTQFTTKRFRNYPPKGRSPSWPIT